MLLSHTSIFGASDTIYLFFFVVDDRRLSHFCGSYRDLVSIEVLELEDILFIPFLALTLATSIQLDCRCLVKAIHILLASHHVLVLLLLD